jgi:response regulator of citrate/malate metabolism
MCNGHSNIASTKLDELATSKIIIRGKKKNLVLLDAYLIKGQCSVGRGVIVSNISCRERSGVV